VLIETILAAFEMDEILYELKEHSSGLNAGRWDYIFSCIKKFKLDKDFCLADRAKVTMTAPFMRAYALLLLKTCHKRGAPAIGGMAALIPIKNDPEKNDIAMGGVRNDKARDATDGYDGGWVAIRAWWNWPWASSPKCWATSRTRSRNNVPTSM